MPFNHCLIPNCVQRYKKSVFTSNNIKRREEWIPLIHSAYPNLKIPKIFLICEDHFKKDDILTKTVIKNSDGKIIFERELTKKKLKDGANPCFTSSLKREEPLNIDSGQQQIDQVIEVNLIEDSRSNQDSCDVTLPSNTSISSPVSLFELQSTSSTYCEEQGLLIEKQHIFQEILYNKIQVNLPDITWGFHRTFELRPQILFTQANMSKEKNMIIIKQVTIYEDLQYKVLFLNKNVLSGQHILENLDDINLLLEHAHSLALCQGGPLITHFKNIYPLCAIQDNITNTWRHKKCPIETSGEEVCKFCVSLYKSLQQNADRKKHTSKKIVLTPSTREKVIALRAAKRVKVQTVRRQKLKQKIVTNIIEQFQSKIENVKRQTLQEHLQNLNIPESQIMLINECISAATRSNTYGRRYSEEWLLLCLLYKIRNSSGYNFLRNNNILPFPSPTTIYRYLRNINTRTGFDPQFFELFQNKLRSLSDIAKNGLLVLDEIQVRKSVAVNAKTLIFDGLVSENHPIDVKNMADHALVFMFTSLADNFRQPIAIFGCVGATKGRVLAQLTLQAIIYLEEVGAHVHGIICDGATTNRKMWDEFGISGKIQKTSYFFENPIDQNRNIYIFSDAPHLIKCIRNRLLKVICKIYSF